MSYIINNTIRVKQINAELVKQTLKQLGEGRKQDIADKTGLSVATCGNILRELVKTGEVKELESAKSNGGRPARRYGYQADFGHLICLYLTTRSQNHWITYTVTNLIGEIKEEKVLKFKEVDCDNLEQTIKNIMKCYCNVKAVAIGIPGVVREGVIGVCDIKELERFPIEEKFAKKFSTMITAENDMNSTVYGFYKQGNYAEDKSVAVICFFKENYPGAGIIVDGHIVRGNSNFAGEISFLDYGIIKEDLLKVLNKQEKFISIAAKAIVSMIAVINPKAIVLTGDLFHSDQKVTIGEECLKFIPREHMPELFIRENMEEDYRNGLIAIALEKLTCGVQLVKKRI